MWERKKNFDALGRDLMNFVEMVGKIIRWKKYVSARLN